MSFLLPVIFFGHVATAFGGGAVVPLPCGGDLARWAAEPACLASFPRPPIGIAVGNSREAYVALATARDHPELRCVVALSPVVSLAALAEFHGRGASLADAPGGLAQRKVFLAIGARDDRVGTENTIALARALWARGGDATLYIAPSEGHRTPPAAAEIAAEWARENCR